MNGIMIAVIAIAAIGLIAAAILYVASKRFAVYEDPRIAEINEVLPQANCGGCGYPGCSGFATACAGAENLDDLFCPVGGQPCMEDVASIMGFEAKEATPKVAVVRCQGSCAHRPRTSQYDGAMTCAIAAVTYGGETGCTHGCLGCGDCVTACGFDAIHMNPETGLPEVDEDKCTGCGACVTACPKDIIELRNQGKKNRRVFVSCVNTDKGAKTRKACDIGCIGCGKCVKECPFDAITLENNVAYIDYEKCKLCRKCVAVCPTHAIVEVNFPAKKPKMAVVKKAEGAAPAAKPAAKPATEAPAKEAPVKEAPKAEAKPAASPAEATPVKESPKPNA